MEGKNGMNRIPQTQENKKGKEDGLLFGQLLVDSRNAVGKKRMQVAQVLELRDSSLVKWEDGSSFPTENRLLDIAKAYGIDPQKLSEAYEISKVAREKEKNLRKSFKPRPGSSKSPYSPY